MKKNILVLGGTGFFGIHMVKNLLKAGHNVTIATRGLRKNPFEEQTNHVVIERTNATSLSTAFRGKNFDIVVDNLVFCSNDIKYLLDVVKTERYVFTTTVAVYDENYCMNMPESHFNPLSAPFVWCSRGILPYGESKRQAERAVSQIYADIPSAIARIPFVIGEDDFTKRLYFYVDHVVNEKPMNINNMDENLGFIYSDDAGAFLAWIALHDFTGPVNGENSGGISVKEIIEYVERKTGKRALLDKNGDMGAYNGRRTFSMSVEKANNFGFHFSKLSDRFFTLLDKYISIASNI